MNETLAKVADWLNHYDENETSIKEAKQKLTDSREQALFNVEEHTEGLVNKIQQNEKELKKTINNTYEANVKVLDTQLDRIELVKVQVQSSMEYAKNLVELGTDAGLMSVNKQTQEMLEGLVTEEIQVGPQFDHSLQYLPNMAFANGQQGSVTQNKTEVAKSSVYNKAVPFNSFILNTKSYVTMNREITYMLSICDKHGNLVKKGVTDSEVTAKVSYKEYKLNSKKTRHSDGTYGITFTPSERACHRLEVSLFGQPVKNSPIYINQFLPLEKDKTLYKRLRRPSGVAFFKDDLFFVADHDNSQIQVIDKTDWYRYERKFTVECGGEKVQPCDVAFTREEHLIITDGNGSQVCLCDTDGNLLRRFGKGEIERPEGVAVGSDGQRIHVVDWGGDCVKTFTPEGTLVRTIGQRGDQPGEFKHPYGVAVNSKDQIIVSDTGNHRLQVFDSTGAFLFACSKELNSPWGVTVDKHDNILLCESNWDNNRNYIRMFSPKGDYLESVYEGIERLHAITTVSNDPLKVVVTELKDNRVIVMQIQKI